MNKFKVGDMVEVSDHEDFRDKERILYALTHNDKMYFRYTENSKQLTHYKYCRPIQPVIEVTIDGETFNPSEKLRKEILDEQTIRG